MFSNRPTPLRLTVRSPINPPPQGTAWLVDGRYVVTAFHVVARSNRWIHEIFKEASVRYELELGDEVVDLRVLPKGRFEDVAAFSLVAPVAADLQSASSFDQLDCDPIENEAYEADGYWARDPTGPHPRRGQITNVQPSRLVLGVDGGTRVDWGGLSGSAVTQGRWVVGLLRADVGEADRAYASPVAHIEAAIEACRADAKEPPCRADGPPRPSALDALSALGEILACPAAWASRVRAANPRLSPDFAWVHLTDRQRNDGAVRELVRRVVVAAAVVVFPAIAALALSTPSRHTEYYFRHLCLAVVATLVAGATVAAVSSFAAGVAATCVGMLAGSAAVRLAIEFTHRGHPGTAVAMGTFLGTAAATASALDAPRRRGVRRPLLADVANGAYAAAVLVLVALAAWVASRVMAPIDRQRDVSLMALACAAVGVIIGAVVGWTARTQRLRKTVLPAAGDGWTLFARAGTPYVAAGIVAGYAAAREAEPETSPAYGAALGVFVGSFVASVLGAMQVASERRAGDGSNKLFAAVGTVAVFALLLMLRAFIAMPGRVETVEYVVVALAASFGVVRGLHGVSQRDRARV
ncbi:MAG: hypothetical protein JNK05_31890 [Myxococcales bacterium]|nr:hypothetical protein [Myxococcales bacterium]